MLIPSAMVIFLCKTSARHLGSATSERRRATTCLNPPGTVRAALAKRRYFVVPYTALQPVFEVPLSCSKRTQVYFDSNSWPLYAFKHLVKLIPVIALALASPVQPFKGDSRKPVMINATHPT